MNTPEDDLPFLNFFYITDQFTFLNFFCFGFAEDHTHLKPVLKNVPDTLTLLVSDAILQQRSKSDTSQTITDKNDCITNHP